MIPAGNEEASIGPCLQSLVCQSAPGFELGREWELMVVDDGSSDRTAAIAAGFPGVAVMRAPELPPGWTGKANALAAAAAKARGRWLLFTDADTIHEAGNLGRAVREAERYGVGMLSYSPRQIVSGLAQRALMPVVYSELALAYPPARVSDPESRLAAANGQFLLVSREAYRAIGGHGAVAADVLEDVRLAELAKRRGLGLRFRYAPDAVSTRMYRSTAAMLAGWRKNLASLFANPLTTAAWKLLDLLLLAALPVLILRFWNSAFPGVLAAFPGPLPRYLLVLLLLRTLWRVYGRAARSNFPWPDCLLAPFGLVLLVPLLVMSWFDHAVQKSVTWKGRTYRT
jgi:glycosyltransferase involved in cell wall biosynthesis